MTASATPTIYDPKVLAKGALGTTLTTTLYTAPNEAGVKVDSIVVTNTGTTARAVTIDLYDGSTGRKLISAATFPTDGIGIDVLKLIGAQYLMLDATYLIRGGQGAGTDCDFWISGVEMKD